MFEEWFVVEWLSFLYTASVSLNRLNEALDKNDKALLLEALQSPHLGLRNVTADNIEFYLQKLKDMREVKKVRDFSNILCCEILKFDNLSLSRIVLHVLNC